MGPGGAPRHEECSLASTMLGQVWKRVAYTLGVLVEVVRCAMSWPSFVFDGGAVWALADAGQHADVPFHLIPKKTSRVGDPQRCPRAALAACVDKETYNCNATDMDPGAVALIVDLAKASERELRVLRGSFAHQGRVRFEGCDADPLQTTTAVLPGPKRWVLLFRCVCRMRWEEVLRVYT